MWIIPPIIQAKRQIKRALDIASFVDDSLVDSNGNFISTERPIYTYGEQPNPWDVPKFTKVGYDPACLTGSGATTLPIEMVSDLVNWRFSSPAQVLYSKSGTIASPLVSGVAGTSAEANMWGSLNPIMIPAYMMYKGFRGRLKCTLIKSGTTATWQIWIRIGRTALGDGITANDQLFTLTNGTILTNASGRQYQVDVEFTVTSAGVALSSPPATAGETVCSFITKMSLQPNAAGTSIATDRSGLMSTVDDMYVNINTLGTAGDTFSLLDYTFIAMPI